MITIQSEKSSISMVAMLKAMNIFKPVFISYSLESMQLKELADELKRYLNQYPDMADKEIYWMQLDIAATKDNIGIDNRD